MSSLKSVESSYSGLPLSTGPKRRAVTVMAAPLQPKQRVRSESAAVYGYRKRKGQEHAGAPCAEAKWLT
jgi:hypothetical protein